MSRAQTNHIVQLQLELEAAQKRIAELEAQRAPIPGITDGTRDHEPYTLDEVTAIETQRGKPYARLRATVERIAKLESHNTHCVVGLEAYGGFPCRRCLPCVRRERDVLKARIVELEENARTLGDSWALARFENETLKAQVAALREGLGSLVVWAQWHRERGAKHPKMNEPNTGALSAARALLSAPNPAEGYTLVANETLRRVREFIGLMRKGALAEAAEPMPMYGSFHGGDPRDFTPDPECSTDAEREAHRVACEKAAAEEGARALPDTHRWVELEGGGAAHIHGPGFGLGTSIVRNPQAEELLAEARALIQLLPEVKP